MQKQMCNIGDVFYRIFFNNPDKKPVKITITRIEYCGFGSYPHYSYYCDYDNQRIHNEQFNKLIFKTYNEAMAKLEKMKKIKEKRIKLKEYENKLNKELGLEDHIIIK